MNPSVDIKKGDAGIFTQEGNKSGVLAASLSRQRDKVRPREPVVRIPWLERPKHQTKRRQATEIRGRGAIAPAAACLRSHVFQRVVVNLIVMGAAGAQ
jgi:hypothetical protein